MPSKKPEQKPPRANDPAEDPRFPRFAELYVSGLDKKFRPGNAHRAAIEAGYPADYAKSHAHKLRARLVLKIGPVLRSQGIDELFITTRLKKLARAKTPKWNPAKLVAEAKPAQVKDGQVILEAQKEVRGGWDQFEAADVQLGALELAVDLIGARPPKVIKGDGPGGALTLHLKHSIPQPRREPKVSPPDEPSDTAKALAKVMGPPKGV